ncbi:MAG: hypothetical protein M5U31_06060 [Acidimicrobiia bacterium]|nr:hypothetical protein [Acidimicrobiia bacterium]
MPASLVIAGFVAHGESVTTPLLVFIGPSGSGKSSVVRSLVERGIIRVHPTWTTRPRRDDETAGSPEHRFVSEKQFLALHREGFFLDAVQMFGLPHWYGLPGIDTADTDGVDAGVVDAVMLRAPLIPRLREHFPDPVIYQIEASAGVLEERLGERHYGSRELRARLADNDAEKLAGRKIAHRRFSSDRALDTVADDVERAVREDYTRRLSNTPNSPLRTTRRRERPWSMS